MAPVVSWIIVALVAAAAIMLVAGAAGDRSGGLRQFLADLRAGLRPGRDRRGGMLGDVRRDLAAAADVERSSVDELFAFSPQDGNAYVQPQELSRTLGRATSRAVKGVTSLSGR